MAVPRPTRRNTGFRCESLGGTTPTVLLHARVETMRCADNEAGFSLIEMLIVMAILGILSLIAVPQLLDAVDRGRQRRSMADMRNIAGAAGTFHVDTGAYPVSLASMTPTYMQATPINDGWGNAWGYAGGTTYTLTSLGSDGAVGPVPPTPWISDPASADLILTDGQFIQAPTAQ